MSEDELLEVLEEFETVSEIKEFFENNCKSKALKPFELTLLKEAKKSYQSKKNYIHDIRVKDIQAFNNSSYDNKTPMYIINHAQNTDNALKAYMNNPESLIESNSREKLSFLLVQDKEGNDQYFLEVQGNHRVLILLILSDVCEELCLNDVEVTKLIS